MPASIKRLLCLGSIFLVIGCIDPKDRRPGSWLSGEVVSGPVDDWSFSQEHREIFIETVTPYLIPHSVTIVCAALDGHLYVGARNPTSKRWVGYVARDPSVRLEIGDKIYERSLERIEDPAELESVYGAFVTKYDREIVPPAERPEVWYYRVVERG